MELLETVQQRVMKLIKGLKHLLCEKRLRGLELFSLEKIRVRGGSTGVYKHLNGGFKENGARFFSVVPSDRTRSNGHSLKHMMLPVNIRKHFSTVRVNNYWQQLPREVVESLSWEIFNI